MKAIVCDHCGKTVLIPDEVDRFSPDIGFHRLYSDTLRKSVLDLCNECAEDLIKAVRQEKK